MLVHPVALLEAKLSIWLMSSTPSSWQVLSWDIPVITSLGGGHHLQWPKAARLEGALQLPSPLCYHSGWPLSR